MAYVPGTKLIKTGTYPQYNWQNGPDAVKAAKFRSLVVKPKHYIIKTSGIKGPFGR